MNTMWNNMCRACLTSKESFTYYLFDDISPDTYFYCTSIKINEDKSLPKALCTVCYELLKKIAEFKHTCLQSENTLHLYGKNVKTEEIECNLENGTNENQKDDNEVNVECTLVRDIKQEDFSDNFNEDSLPPDCTDAVLNETTENVALTQKKRKKARSVLKKRHNGCSISELIKKKLIYRCEVCNRHFIYEKSYKAHKLEHDTKGNAPTSLQCETCNKTFATSSGLKRHEQSAHAPVRLASMSCRKCGRVCASKHSLRAHEKAHGVVRVQCVCHICGKRVSTPVILKAHLETHKADRERRHTCEHCGKKFFTTNMLFSHIKRLHSGLRFICEICNFAFTDKYNLAKHIVIHEGKKLFKCDICDKSYSANASLIEHKRTHSGERPFNCSFCPKSFLSRRRLLEHHRTHTGDKPHKCSVCEQRFTQRGTLNRHMKVHDPMKMAQVVPG